MQVLALCGSTSDLPIMESTVKTLKQFNIDFVLHVASAHRTPARVRELITEAEGNGTRVIIAAAGMAAHLAGAVAGLTTLPVVGVPLPGGAMDGQDALLSTVMMPPGMPVATMAIGKPGAINAALFAVQILALDDPKLADALKAHRKAKADAILRDDPAITG